MVQFVMAPVDEIRASVHALLDAEAAKWDRGGESPAAVYSMTSIVLNWAVARARDDFGMNIRVIPDSKQRKKKRCACGR